MGFLWHPRQQLGDLHQGQAREQSCGWRGGLDSSLLTMLGDRNPTVLTSSAKKITSVAKNFQQAELLSEHWILAPQAQNADNLELRVRASRLVGRHVVPECMWKALAVMNRSPEKRNCRLTYVINARCTEGKHVFSQRTVCFPRSAVSYSIGRNVVSLPRSRHDQSNQWLEIMPLPMLSEA